MAFVGVGRHCATEVAADTFWRSRVAKEDGRVAEAPPVPRAAGGFNNLGAVRTNTLGVPSLPPRVLAPNDDGPHVAELHKYKAKALALADKPNAVDPHAPPDTEMDARAARKAAMRQRLLSLEDELAKERERARKAQSQLSNFVDIMETSKAAAMIRDPGVKQHRRR